MKDYGIEDGQRTGDYGIEDVHILGDNYVVEVSTVRRLWD